MEREREHLALEGEGHRGREATVTTGLGAASQRDLLSAVLM